MLPARITAPPVSRLVLIVSPLAARLDRATRANIGSGEERVTQRAPADF
jgi:hypothetical protein